MYPEYLRHKGQRSSPSPSSGNRGDGYLRPTTEDIEGPFYKEGAPIAQILSRNASISLRGKVTDTHGNSIQLATLDFWQADEQGKYDNVGYNFRGKQLTNEKGEYYLETVMPGNYEISETEHRCAHIHVKVTVLGKTLTTQLYFPDAEYNETDNWFDESRVVEVLPSRGEQYSFDFVIQE